jgi:hypothetical protein
MSENVDRLRMLESGFWTNKKGEAVPLSDVGDIWLMHLLKKLDIYRTGNSSRADRMNKMYTLILAECDKRKLVTSSPRSNKLCHCGRAGLYNVRVMQNGHLRSHYFCAEHRQEAMTLQKVVMAKRDVGKTLREKDRKEFDQEDACRSAAKKTTKFGKGGYR